MQISLHNVRVLLLTCAFVFGLFASISLPHISSMDMARVYWISNPLRGGEVMDTQLRFGVWAVCMETSEGARSCSGGGPGYHFYIPMLEINVPSSWTRGLVAQPIATAFACLSLSFSSSRRTSFGFVTTFLAAFFNVLAFAATIALCARVQLEVHKLSNGLVRDVVKPGSGFWLSSLSMIMLLLATFLSCYGERPDDKSGQPHHSVLHDAEDFATVEMRHRAL